MIGRAKGALGNIIIPLGAFFLALVFNGIIILFFGFNPLAVYQAVLTGAAGSVQAFLQTLSQSTVLILSGLSFAIAYKAGMINIGAEGQLYMGAIFGAIAGIYLPLPGIIHKIVVILIAASAGAMWAMISGFLKVRFNANEVITTIMLNTIAANFSGYLVNYPMKAEGLTAQSERLRDTALIQRLSSSSQFNMTFFLALGITFLAFVIIHKTVTGYEIRVTGLNKSAAQAAGINVKWRMVVSMGLSGAAAGCAGIFQVMAINTRLIDGFSSGYGFDGVAVSALAGGNIIGVIFSGILFGAFKTGATVVQRISHVPSDFIKILQSMVIIFVAAPSMVLYFRDLMQGPLKFLRCKFSGANKKAD
jgi:simple sugar transport system permease protein